MGFNLGAGLSEMGGSIAQTAGQMQLEKQKSDLETQKELLVDKLTTDRETKLEGMRETGAQALQKLATQGQLEVVSATAKAQIDTHVQEIADDTNEAVSKLKKLSSPDMIAAQRAITLASVVPNATLQVKDDGTAVAFDPVSKKITPIMDNGQPVKFQNPAVAQAVVQQTTALKDAGNNLDRMYKSDMDAYRVLHKDDSPEELQTGLDNIQKYYRPKIEEINGQLQSLTSALSVKTGIGVKSGAPTGAPPLSSFLGGGAGTQVTPPTGGAGASFPVSGFSGSLLNGR